MLSNGDEEEEEEMKVLEGETPFSSHHENYCWSMADKNIVSVCVIAAAFIRLCVQSGNLHV